MIQTDQKRIWLSSPHMGGDEQKYVQQAFDENWIAPLGPNVNGFEEDIQAFYSNEAFAAALSSGTSALHLALILADVKYGDEVLCQSMTFSASANPIAYQGATPVFIDSEKETWNICPAQLRTAIEDRLRNGKKPKALIAVHLYGMPYKYEAIREITEAYNIVLIEDSAEALGSTYHGKKCGILGDLSILSFNGNKIITTSGGGALVTTSKVYKDKAVFLATQARDQAPHYQHSQIGYNYRMSNIVAGIGRGQMKVLSERVEARRANYDYYKNELQNNTNVQFWDEPLGYYSNRWLTCITTDSYESRERIRVRLAKESIESRPLWKPMHQQPVFKDCPAYTNGVSDDLFDRGLCLPSGSNLTREDLDRVLYYLKQEI